MSQQYSHRKRDSFSLLVEMLESMSQPLAASFAAEINANSVSNLVKPL